MSDYTVNVNDPTEPIDSRDAWKMAAEMRALKQKLLDTVAAVSVPTGLLLPFAGTVAPSGWFLIPNNIDTMSYHVGGPSSIASILKGAQYFDLFSVLWQNTNLQMFDASFNPVSKGVSAASDWAANASISLPPISGRAIAGNSAGHVFGTLFGEESHVLTASEMPPHSHQIRESTGGAEAGGPAGSNGSGAIAFNTELSGGGNAHNNVQPTYYTCFIIKL